MLPYFTDADEVSPAIPVSLSNGQSCSVTGKRADPKCYGTPGQACPNDNWVGWLLRCLPLNETLWKVEKYRTILKSKALNTSLIVI